MLTKLQKRYIIGLIAYSVSIFIWRINESFGNVFRTNFILSTTTFLIIYVPFEIYFSFRDIWFERWEKLENPQVKEEEIKIPIGNKQKERHLTGQIMNIKSDNNFKSKKTIIIISHGFSDTIEDYHYLYIPLVLNGYTILTYDSRGIGKSKAVGNRYEFEKRIQDFKKIVSWVKNTSPYKDMKIYTIGFSIGAMVTLTGGFMNQSIRKIIAISSISSYKESIKSMNPYVLFIYLLKRVPVFISDKKARKLSPYYIFSQAKKNSTKSEWNSLKDRIFLIHSRNDKITPFDNFKKNLKILDLKESNQLIFEKGGHSMKKNEIELISSILAFFNKK